MWDQHCLDCRGEPSEARGLSYLKSSSTACGKVWKLLFRFICVPSTMAIFPNICKAQTARMRAFPQFVSFQRLLLDLLPTLTPYFMSTPFTSGRIRSEARHAGFLSRSQNTLPLDPEAW